MNSSLPMRILLAFVLALGLTIVPMPGFLGGVRPLWVMLLVIYVQCYLPNHYNIPMLFVVGLSLDVLLSTVIGEHTLVLSFVSWVISFKVRRFHLFTMEQQIALVGLLSIFYKILVWVIDSYLGYPTTVISVVGSAVISMLLWPWLRLIADDALLSKCNHRRF